MIIAVDHRSRNISLPIKAKDSKEETAALRQLANDSNVSAGTAVLALC